MVIDKNNERPNFYKTNIYINKTKQIHLEISCIPENVHHAVANKFEKHEEVFYSVCIDVKKFSFVKCKDIIENLYSQRNKFCDYP